MLISTHEFRLLEAFCSIAPVFIDPFLFDLSNQGTGAEVIELSDSAADVIDIKDNYISSQCDDRCCYCEC